MQGSLDKALVALRRIIRATDMDSKKFSKSVGLTLPQLMMLEVIKESGDISTGVLAKELCLTQANVTSVLDRFCD